MKSINREVKAQKDSNRARNIRAANRKENEKASKTCRLGIVNVRVNGVKQRSNKKVARKKQEELTTRNKAPRFQSKHNHLAEFVPATFGKHKISYLCIITTYVYLL